MNTIPFGPLFSTGTQNANTTSEAKDKSQPDPAPQSSGSSSQDTRTDETSAEQSRPSQAPAERTISASPSKPVPPRETALSDAASRASAASQEALVQSQIEAELTPSAEQDLDNARAAAEAYREQSLIERQLEKVAAPGDAPVIAPLASQSDSDSPSAKDTAKLDIAV